jgi:transposase InsO family protein
LEGTHLTEWEQQTNGMNQIMAAFDVQFIAFKQSLLQGYSYLDQIDYLCAVKKTRDQQPKDFLRLLRHSETLACQLPDAPPNAGFSDEERKRIFLHAMPIDWQNKFIEANMRTEDETLEDMRVYFDRLQQLYPYEENKSSDNGNNDSRRTNNGGGRDRRHRSNNNNQRRGGNGNNNNNRNERRQGNTSNRIQPTDPCPLPGHGNHTWGECRSNRYNNESQQNQRNNSSNSRGNSHGRNNGSNRQQHNSREANTNERENNTENQSNQINQEQHHYEFVANNPNEDPESFFMDDGVQEDLEETPHEDAIVQPTELTEQERATLTPTTLAVVKKINGEPVKAFFKSLLDPGGSNVMVKRSSLPKQVKLIPIDLQNFTTIGGGPKITHRVVLQDVILPEFSYTRRISKVNAFVFDQDNVQHDIIFGRDFLNTVRIDVCGSDLTCRWYGDSIPFHKPDFYKDNDRVRPLLTIPPSAVQRLENHATAVETSVDTQTSVEDVVVQQTHLNEEQKAQLLQVLKKYENTLFSGRLGTYKRRKFHIDLKDDAVPYHVKGPYPVPAINMPVLKQELRKQCDDGILERVGESEWGMPMMVIPKKDGTIRTIDDFRELNKQTKRKVYPLPKIQDIFHRRKGYKYASQLDLTKMYYTFELDEESSWLCILVTPFGKYRRKRLPMGLKQSPDWAQAAIEIPLIEADLLRECVEAYMDDVGIFSNSFEEHMIHLDKTLYTLDAEGFTINPTKCLWCVQEMQWLGHWLTPEAIKPVNQRIKGIVQLDRPKTVKQLRSFLGMINYYRDFWKRRSHILAPLTALTKSNPKRELPWSDSCTEAFNKIKALLAEEVLLYYPDPNKTFYIEPDASKYQLGSTIYQLNEQGCKQPVAFFSCKLLDAQTRYPPSDLEALSVTETFEEYRSMLYGADIVVRTDHKNLVQRNLKSQRLLHWRLLLEEFSPTFEYLPGPTNTVADALSRLPMTSISAEEAETKLRETLLYYPEEVDQFPLDFQSIATAQQQDPAMMPLADQDDYDLQEFQGIELICRQHEDQWKIVLPEALIEPTIAWYHIVLGHCGISRLHTTLLNHLWFPSMRRRIEAYVNECNHCAMYKFNNRGYGHVPPRNDTGTPWEDVAVDTIGPWKIPIDGGIMLQVHALTIIDVTTTLSEAVRIEDASAAHAALKFHNTWLARYPKPVRVIHDQGREFVGIRFQELLQQEGILSVPTSVRNPQANAVCERLHKTVEDSLNTYLRHQVPPDVTTATELVDSVLAAAQRAIRAAVHSTLKISPGALVFHRDMMLPIPIMADYNLLRERRQALIDYNNARENRKCLFKDYQAGDQVLVLLHEKGKLKPKTTGPFTINAVHVNGTVTINRGPGVTERLSVRRIKPY